MLSAFEDILQRSRSGPGCCTACATKCLWMSDFCFRPYRAKRRATGGSRRLAVSLALCPTAVWCGGYAEPMMCITCAVYCLRARRNACDVPQSVVILSSRLNRDSGCRLRRHTLVCREKGLSASAVRERPALADVDVALLRCSFAQRGTLCVRVWLPGSTCCSSATCSPCGAARLGDGSFLSLAVVGPIGTSFDSWSCFLSTDTAFAEPIRGCVD